MENNENINAEVVFNLIIKNPCYDTNFVEIKSGTRLVEGLTYTLTNDA